MNRLLYLYQSIMTVSGTQWHLLSSDVFLINAIFCVHNIASINGPKLSFTESLVEFTDQRCRLQIRRAGDNNWSVMLSTNLRCSLQICSLINNPRVLITDPQKKI